jgi:microcystin-dependent protein
MNNNTGSNNTYIGYQAGINDLGSNNICIGVNTGPVEDDLTVYTNSVAIGTDVEITASNQINIGKAGDTVNIYGQFNAPYLIPVGTILTHALDSNITGYILCDGRAVSRTTYEDLFDVLDITFGSGNGTTTFNVPNYKGLFLRGNGTNSVHNEYVSAGTAVQQQQQIITHTHISPSNPNSSYVGSGTTASVLSDATVNQPIIEFPSLTVGLGSLNLGALGTFNLGNITIQIPPVTVQTVLTKTNATVINGLNNSTFATNTGSLSTSTVSHGTETRPGNMGVYYHIKY